MFKAALDLNGKESFMGSKVVLIHGSFSRLVSSRGLGPLKVFNSNEDVPCEVGGVNEVRDRLSVDEGG